MVRMSLWGWLKERFFRSGERRSLQNVGTDELRRERIKIEQLESKLTAEIEALELQKEACFQKGVQCASERQKMQHARKVNELDRQVRSCGSQLTLVGRNRQVLTGLIQVKENDALLHHLGVDGLLARMNLTEIQTFVEQATVEGQFQMERFTSLLGAIGDAESVFTVAESDADIAEVLAAMNRAAEAQSAEQVHQALADVATARVPAGDLSVVSSIR